MVDRPTINAAPAVSMEAHVNATKGTDLQLFKGPGGDWWLRNAGRSVSRFPCHCLSTLDTKELKKVFKITHSLLIDWIEEPGEQKAANAHLYLFRGPHYSLEEQNYSARRDARKAFRELEFRTLTCDELLAVGWPVFENTRRRNGLTDGDNGTFVRRFSKMRSEAGYSILGAFKGGEIAAFMSILAIDDWVSIGPFAHSAFRSSCPTDGLLSLVLDYFINERKVALVSYGLSSVQESSSGQGLHDFKLKAGFTDIPVTRNFLLNPWLGMLGTTPLRWTLGVGLKIMPGSPALRKANGVLSLLDSAG